MTVTGLWKKPNRLALIAFQNYIISSVSDIEGSTTSKHAFYKKDKLIDGFEFTKIELIAALANYSKHMDEGHKT